VSNSSSCGATTAVSQGITLGNVGGDISDISFNANTSVNLDCLQSSLNDSQIQSQIKNQLEQYAKSQSEAGQTFFSGALSQSETNNIMSVVNNVSNSVKIDNVKKCVASVVVNQQITAGDIAGSVRSISLNVTASTINKCVQSDASVSKNVTDLANAISQTSESTALAGFSANAIAAAIIIVVIIMCSSSSALLLASQSQSR
jgi:hypothetical protein